MLIDNLWFGSEECFKFCYSKVSIENLLEYKRNQIRPDNKWKVKEETYIIYAANNIVIAFDICIRVDVEV